jgi:hypothetical protein
MVPFKIIAGLHIRWPDNQIYKMVKTIIENSQFRHFFLYISSKITKSGWYCAVTHLPQVSQFFIWPQKFVDGIMLWVWSLLPSVLRHNGLQAISIDANHYDFSVIFTNFGPRLRSTVYLFQISYYCRPGTVPHLNIIVIIYTLHCLLKSCKEKRSRDSDY